MKRNLRFLMMALLCAVFSTAWGDTYYLQQVTSVEAGGLYVFEQDGYVMNNSVSSSALQTTSTYNTSGLLGTETYVWELETATDGYYLKNVSLSSNQYLNNASSTSVSFGDQKSIWRFSFQDDNTVLIQNTSNDNRFLGYTNSTSHAYKAYATSNILSYPHAINVFKLVEGTAPISVAKPTFSVAGDTYYEPISVELSCATEGADIYYTTNGDTPDANSTKYTGAITISETTTLKAIAFKDDVYSAVASATYTINIITPVAGYIIDFESEETAYTDWVFANIVSKQTGTIDAHGGTNYGTTGGKATGSITTKTTIATPSSLTCYVSKLSTNTSESNWKIQVSSDGTTWTDVETMSATGMTKGEWKEFTADLSNYTDVFVRVSYSGSTAVRAIDDLKLIDAPAVSKPVFDPAAGTYTTAQSVTITCATEGATIYYTTNGDEPTTSSTVYNNNTPVSITTTGTTLKAIAVKDGLVDSNVASATYTIQPEAPVISEQNGEIVITAAKGLSIYYTTDGSNPTNENENNKYTAPIPFSGTVTVKAIAYDTYGNPSAVSTKQFSNISPNPKEINSGYYVKVTSESDLEDGDAILIVNEDNKVAISSTQNDNNRGQADVTLGSGFIVDPSADVQKVILVGSSGAWYFCVGDEDNPAYLYAASSSSNWLRTEDTPDNNAKATISFDSEGNATITFQGSNTRNLLKYNSSSSIFSCYKSGQLDVQIYKEVEAETETVNIGSTKYATLYYGTENLIVPANVTAMTYKANGDKIAVSKTYASGEVIPAGTAVVLEGTAAGAYNFFVTTVEGEGDSESNLYGLDVAGTTPAPGEGEYYYYKLSKKSKDAADNTVGFYFGAEGGGQFALTGPHRAYLAIPKPIDGNVVSAFVFDETVGISQIKNVTSNDSIYTLSGVKVSNNNLSKGIYIVNGKKIVIK